MIKHLIQEHRVTFLRYAVVGVIGTVLDIGLFALLITYTPLGETMIGRIVATTVSFVAAVINNYIWNRRWTFKDVQTNVKTQFIKFFVVSCGGWGLNTLCFVMFSWLLPPVIAKIGASGVVLAYNYTANRYWTFRKMPMLEGSF